VDDACATKGKGQHEGDADAAADANNDNDADEPPQAPLRGAEERAPSPNGTVNAGPGRGFEYRDHTADIQIHAWSASLPELLRRVALGMCHYMTPLEGARPDNGRETRLACRGRDLKQLMFNFLDETLVHALTGLIAVSDVVDVKVVGGTSGGRGGGGDGDLDEGEAYRASWTVRGEAFDRARHEVGTEVKAITYSAMQVLPPAEGREGGEWEAFVIVDI